MYDDAQDAVAAEYVLGTLSADEREHAEALLAIDPGFVEAVRLWERRLGELNVMVEAVEPPAAVWDKIRGGIGDVEMSSEVPPLIETAAPPLVTPPSIDTRAKLPASANVPKPSSATAVEMPPARPASGSEALSQVAAIAASLIPSAPDPDPAPASTVLPPAESSPLAPAREARIERSADVVYLARRANRWRRMAVAFGAIAALLAIFVAVTLFAPGLIPLGRLSSGQLVAQSKAPAAAQLVGVLQHDPMSPAFLLTVDPQSRSLTVRRVSATPEPGRSYELWLISGRNAAPRSLGVVGADEFTQRAIPSAIDVGAMRGASYAISLEPGGGSPTGAPTGPILFTGKLVDSAPATTKS